MDQLHKVHEVHDGIPPCSVMVIVVSTNRLHQTQSKWEQLQSDANPQLYMLAIGEQRSTEGVSDTRLLHLACLIVTCCQHPRSLQSHGTSTGPPSTIPNTPAPPCSAEGCIASGSQRLHWFCFTRPSIVVDLCFQN